MNVIVTKLITTVLNISSLPSLNLTLESDSQITIRVITSRLLTYSNSLILVTGLPRIDVFNTDSQAIITPDFKISSAIIDPLIKRLKKPRKIIKSKGYHLLKEDKELDISKRISRDVVFKNIIEEKRSIKRGIILLTY